MKVASLVCNVSLIALLIWVCGAASRHSRLGAVQPLAVSQVAVFIAPTYLLSICQQQGRAQEERRGIWQAIFHVTPKQCVPSARQASRPGPAFGRVLSEMLSHPTLSLFPLEVYFFSCGCRDKVMCLLLG